MSAEPDDLHRMLPASFDAERGVIGSILLSPDYAFEQCEARGLTHVAFHLPAHGTIFSTLAGMQSAQQPIDIITLTNLLRDRGQLDQVGGAAFITELFTHLPTAVNVAHYAGILADKAILRGMVQVGTEYAARAYDEQENAAGLLDEFEAKLLAVRQQDSDANGMREVTAHEGAIEAINSIEQLYERRGKISGLETGFHDLDVLTDGLHPEDFVVIGARPSMGKTALLMDIALHCALSGKRVVIFSAEMSAGQLYQRAICAIAKVNVRNVRDGLIPERAFPAMTSAAQKLSNSRLTVMDAVGASIGAVRARARRLHRKEPLALVVVDYLQKLRHPPSSKYREREIAEVSEGLKNLNKELKVPVVTAAQINRQGADGPPKMHHLRESGSIEADADVILLLDRPEVYAEGEAAKKEVEGVANLEIVKQRSGPLGDVRLTFLKEFTSFVTAARDTAAEPRNYHDD